MFMREKWLIERGSKSIAHFGIICKYINYQINDYFMYGFTTSTFVSQWTNKCVILGPNKKIKIKILPCPVNLIGKHFLSSTYQK